MLSRTAALAGSLLVVGYPEGASGGVSERLLAALRRGERAGAILFRRNIPQNGDFAPLVAAIHSLQEATPDGAPIVAVDQEGGRVRRLPAPALVVPPMRVLSKHPELLEATALAVARELRALGFTMNFAPVLDVASEPKNPIIGDRAFGETADEAIAHATAFARGLAAGGIDGCGKHFPGHGDTTVDSHLALPSVHHARERLDAVEFAPFRAAAAEGTRLFPSLMSAHVRFDAFADTEAEDAGIATLSHALCTNLLRGEFGYDGVLFSDDLEMKALDAVGDGDRGKHAVSAITAGCDALLVCSDEDLADHVHAALVAAIEASPLFRARCEAAARRVARLRRKTTPSLDAFQQCVDAHRPLAARLEALAEEAKNR
jgi:beta-N-acetylhexosaminidase